MESILLFDEIHKYARCRNLIKGIYDTEFLTPSTFTLDVKGVSFGTAPPFALSTSKGDKAMKKLKYFRRLDGQWWAMHSDCIDIN